MGYIDGEYYVDVSRSNRLYDIGHIDPDIWETQIFGYIIMAANEDIDFAKREAKRFGIYYDIDWNNDPIKLMRE